MNDWLAETTENPDIERIQDGAFLEWIMYQWSKIRADDSEPLAGQILNGMELTISGMILGAHLIGETKFRDPYIFSGGTIIPTDGDGTNGTPVTQYIEQFGGYDITDLTGVDPDIIPAGFADYFVINHYLNNTFNRHSDDNIDLIGNSNTNDYPMHLGTGDDVINGFGGDDTFYGASRGNDILDGGSNNLGIGGLLSYIEYDGSVSITLLSPRNGPEPAAFRATGAGGWTDSFVNFERLELTGGNDSIDFQNDGGGPGSEYDGMIILAAAGNDTVRGGSAADSISGGAGADHLFGGGGNDVIIFDASDSAVDGGQGWDIAIAADGAGVSIDMSAQGFEAFAGGAGDDSITVTRDGMGPKIVWGGAGADNINMVRGENWMQAGILVVSATNLTQDTFQTLTPAMLEQWGVDLSKIGVIVLNPDSADTFSSDGEVISIGNYTHYVMIGDAAVASVSAIGWQDVPISTKVSTYLGPSLTIQGFWDGGFPDANDVGAFSLQEFNFGGALSPEEVAEKLQDLFPEVDGFNWIVTGVLDEEDSMNQIIFYQVLGGYSSPMAADAGYASWFVAGGEFSGTALSANGPFTLSFDSGPIV